MTVVARAIEVRFGGIRALDGVDLDVERGQIVGLLGPNGAGKTTLFNTITGVVRPTAGTVSIDDTDVSGKGVNDRVRLGVSRTFQTPRLDLESSVLDAVMLGFTSRVEQSWLSQLLGTRAVRRKEEELRHRAEELIRQLSITNDPSRRSGDLSLGTLRLVEVARALAAEPNYLLLDEPAAGTDQQDRELLGQAIRDAAARGLGVLLVEHNVPFVAELSHHLAVLVEGRVIARGKPDEVLANPDVMKAYVGESHAH